jgi:hypothetical protein
MELKKYLEMLYSTIRLGFKGFHMGRVIKVLLIKVLKTD